VHGRHSACVVPEVKWVWITMADGRTVWVCMSTRLLLVSSAAKRGRLWTPEAGLLVVRWRRFLVVMLLLLLLLLLVIFLMKL